jgi:SAM-dependent methyltransferase
MSLFLGLAASGARQILELAVGSGRVAVPLAAAGHEVTGVDSDAAMLDRARAAWERVGPGGRGGKLRLVERDLVTLELGARFDLVILALNSLLLLDGRAAQQSALHVMRAHLAPKGRAVVDVWLPTRDDLELYDGRQMLDWIRTDPQTNERVAKTTIAQYDTATGTATLSTTFDVGRDDAPSRSTSRTDAISFIGAAELLELARSAGLAPEEVLGDYARAPWSEASERIVLIARAG